MTEPWLNQALMESAYRSGAEYSKPLCLFLHLIGTCKYSWYGKKHQELGWILADTAEYSFTLQYTNKLILKGTARVNSSDPVVIKMACLIHNGTLTHFVWTSMSDIFFKWLF